MRVLPNDGDEWVGVWDSLGGWCRKNPHPPPPRVGGEAHNPPHPPHEDGSFFKSQSLGGWVSEPPPPALWISTSLVCTPKPVPAPLPLI